MQNRKMDITYRKVDLTSQDEMKTIAEIDMSIPALFDPLFQVNEQTIAERLGHLMKCKPDDFFEVAVSPKSKIVGYHFLNKFRSPHGVWAANVQTLWVAAEFRKRGIATHLKKRGETWAKEQGLDHISTFVHHKNSSMMGLNKNLDYEVVGFKLRKNLR